MRENNFIDYQKYLSEIAEFEKKILDTGCVASYIPELKNIDPSKFGIHIATVNNENYGLGDSNEKFSIQSIAKILALALAFDLVDEKLWDRVGVEPSGTAFNSLIQLEYEKGIPRNPLINAGALVLCDILVSHLKSPKQDFIKYVRDISGNHDIHYCLKVSESEKATGFKNKALVNLMKAYGNINNDIEIVMDFYFSLCSIEMTCSELANEFLFLANNGISPFNNKQIVSARKAKRINAIMQLCGFYDEAGEFSFKVGLPGKSGVGGGIVAIYPGRYSVAVWSPKLNTKGNSYKGMRILEFLTTRTGLSIF